MKRENNLNSIKFTNFPISVGRFPFNLLNLKSKFVRLVKFPIDGGIT